MTNLDTNAPGMGHNIDDATDVVVRLETDYAAEVRDAEALMDEARDFPKEVNDDDTMLSGSALVKRLNDSCKLLESHRVKEKAPFLRGGQAVDSFFMRVIEKVTRQKKTDKPGAADIIHARVDSYNQRKLAEEQARRQREREQAEAAERETARKAEAARIAAEEAAKAAERARKPENIAARTDEANTAAQVADQTSVDAAVATLVADDAIAAAAAKPADLVRHRGDTGVMTTMRQEGYAEIVDVMLLDKNALWAFIKTDAIESALKQWARTTGHKQQMSGADIGFRNKTVIR